MDVLSKQDKILDALQELLENSDIQKISVSDIAEKAGIGKGSIYYYFSSKNDIFGALIERSYQTALETAKELANRTEIPPFTRMAMISQACNHAAVRLSAYKDSNTIESIQEKRDKTKSPKITSWGSFCFHSQWALRMVASTNWQRVRPSWV